MQAAPEYHFRRMAAADIPAVHDMIMLSYRQSFAGNISPDGDAAFKKHFSPDVISERLETHPYWIALDSANAIAGAAGISEGPHLAMFFVHPGHFGRGIGRQLFELVLAHCRQESAGEAFRITVKSSPYAVEVYRKLGFRESEGHTDAIHIPMFWESNSR